VNALANAEVGDYLNKHFASSYQKVGTFRVVSGQKQGGNVASYFCTPQGEILDAVPGPVDAAALLREARWVVETRKMALLDSRGDPGLMRRAFRLAHADRLGNSVPGVDWKRLPYFAPSEKRLEVLLDANKVAQQLDQEAKVHLILALYPQVKLDLAYKVVYEKVLGETVTTQPVSVTK
jgi:hypothetical protein